MADLTFTQLQAITSLPAGTFFLSGGRVCVDVEKLIGETVDSLNDAQVTETVFKLAQIANAAQTVFNDNDGAPLTSGNRIRSFSEPSYSTPFPLPNKQMAITASVRIQAQMLVNQNSISAVLS